VQSCLENVQVVAEIMNCSFKTLIRQKINSLFQWKEKGAELRKIKRENINLKAPYRLNCFENNNWEII